MVDGSIMLFAVVGDVFRDMVRFKMVGDSVRDLGVRVDRMMRTVMSMVMSGGVRRGCRSHTARWGVAGSEVVCNSVGGGGEDSEVVGEMEGEVGVGGGRQQSRRISEDLGGQSATMLGRVGGWGPKALGRLDGDLIEVDGVCNDGWVVGSEVVGEADGGLGGERQVVSGR